MSTPPPPAPTSPGGASQPGKIRNWLAPILLSIITLGIYYFVYQFKTFKEMKAFSGNGIGGGVALIFAFLCSIVNLFLLPAEVGDLYVGDSKERPVSAVTALWNLIPILGTFIYYFKVQGALNELWESKGATKD
jgi:Domain of unknown function (DUF4234)